MKLNLRDMTEEDLPDALAIEREVYPQPWSERVFRDELAAPSRVYLVAETDDVMIGYGGLMVIADEAHITTVVVRPEWRAHKVGTRLMLALVDAAVDGGARGLTLEVRTSNIAAQALYHRFQMEPVGVRKRYYVTEDALVYWAHEIHRPEYRAVLDSIKAGL